MRIYRGGFVRLVLETVLATNTGIRIVFANTVRECLNRPIILDYSNIRVLPEYYSNSTCNVTCNTMCHVTLLFGTSSWLFLSHTSLERARA